MFRILNNRNKSKKPLYDRGNYERRLNKDPLAAGEAKDIAKLFIWPFVAQYKPEGTSIENFLDELFQTNYRKIERYRCLEKFVMPGRIAIDSHIDSTIKVRRIVRSEQVMWIRTDSKMPNRIDIELVYRDNRSTVFKLDQAQYSTILGFVSHWPYRCHSCVGHYE